MDTEKFIENGKALGYEGQELREYVREQENKARDERAERRRLETQEAENKRKHEAEEADKQRIQEAEKRQHDKEMLEKQEKVKQDDEKRRQQIEADKEKSKQEEEKRRQQMEADKAKQIKAEEKQHQQMAAEKQKESERSQKEQELEIQRLQKEADRLEKESDKLKLQLALAADREKNASEIAAKEKEQRNFEADQKEKDRLAQIQIGKDKNLSMLEAKKMELDAKADLDIQKRQDQKDVPRHKKYQHVIRHFTKDDNFPAWLKNMERCLREDEVPTDDWAYILKKSLSGEPQKLIENVGERFISSYEYLKEKLLQHFKCDSEGYRVRFRNLTPKSNQTFFDYLTEVEAMLDNWLDAEAVDKSFERFHQMVIKDKIVSSIPTQMAKFLQEQRITSLQDLEEKGTAYFNANRDVFALNAQPEFDVGAATNWSKDTSKKKLTKWKSNKPSQPKSEFNPETSCRYCRRSHSKKVLCDQSPEGKKYLSKHISYASERRKQCAAENRCFCCKIFGHTARYCLCKGKRQYAGAIQSVHEPNQHITTKYMREYMHSLGLDSEEDESNYSPSSSEDEWERQANAYGNSAEIDYSTQTNNCDTCKSFHQKTTLSCGHKIPVADSMANSVSVSEGKLKLYPAIVNGQKVNLLRDTGATLVGIQKDLVQDDAYTGESIICRTFGGTKERYPLALIDLDSAFLSKRLIAAVLPNPCANIILGNVENIKECSEDDIQDWIKEKDIELQGNATTRRQTQIQESLKEQETMEMILPNQTSDETRSKFIKAQKEDESLKQCFDRVDSKKMSGKSASWKFTSRKGILTRLYTKANKTVSQVVLPTIYRTKALDIAHSNPFAGHLGSAKTKARLLYQFYWPGFTQTVKLFCKTCKICQHMSPKGKHPRAYVQPTDLSSRPFQKVAVDIVGPLNTVSDKGNRFILTMVDMCTRWPEAIPLKFITSEAITEAFFHLFSRIGFPEVILSDRGTQFISKATQAVSQMMGIKQVFTTPYNPPANGVCENFNGTLKKMLAKVTDENPSTWDTLLPAILFAYREVPQKSTGYSPFELVYGANPRGPLTIYKELLIGKINDEQNLSNAELVTNLRHKIITACEEAKESLKEAGIQHRFYANRKAKKIVLSPKDQVLLLLPDNSDKLSVLWQGPYEITRKISDVDYEVKIKDKLKVYHINMLKPFTLEDTKPNETDIQTESNDRYDNQVAASLITEKDNDDLQTEIVIPETKSDSSWKDCNVSKSMPTQYKQQLVKLLKEYSSIFSNKPGRTNLIEHEIKVSTESPVRVKPYPIPVHYKAQVEKEIEELEKNGIIVRSNSNYCSPMFIIKKKDDTLRICIDYRQLNAITITDAEPIPSVDDLMLTLAHSKVFSKLDMTKGYYQIPVTKDSRYLTAFAAPQGLFEWVYMPFGLVNAPATFVRMTRLLLKGLSNITTYMDDMCVNNDNYEDHIASLRQVFERIKQANLTIKPAKVDLCFTEIAFLGHNVSKGTITTDDNIISKILKLEVPTTKKQVRSLLGLMNYYAKFIPGFAEKTQLFSTLLGKSYPAKIKWSNELNVAFENLKSLFSQRPILKIANFKLPFILQTDASGTAIAACLLQVYDNVLHPVLYISKKLNQAERNYSTVEKEALAIVYSVLKLKKYLLGRKFLILTDNKPLAILNSKLPKNSRLTRWSLLLQDYSFEIQHVKGIYNCLPDILSRL
ncbi:hypothetical protein BsWGS_08486 [Bradybaena similaris]